MSRSGLRCFQNPFSVPALHVAEADPLLAVEPHHSASRLTGMWSVGPVETFDAGQQHRQFEILDGRRCCFMMLAVERSSPRRQHGFERHRRIVAIDEVLVAPVLARMYLFMNSRNVFRPIVLPRRVHRVLHIGRRI